MLCVCVRGHVLSCLNLHVGSSVCGGNCVTVVCVCVCHYLQSEHLSVCINQQELFLHHSRPEASMPRSDTHTTSCSLLPPSFFLLPLVRLLRSLLCWTRGRLLSLNCSSHPPRQDFTLHCFYFLSPVEHTHFHTCCIKHSVL